MKTNFKKAPALTLVEMILYVAITTVIATSMVLYGVRLVTIRADQEFERELNQEARFALDVITRNVHDAAGVSTGSFEVHPSSLTLVPDSGGTSVISTATKAVGDQTIRFVQLDGTQITSDRVDVTNFVINELTRDTEPENLQFEITLETLDGKDSLSLQTAVSLRE